MPQSPDMTIRRERWSTNFYSTPDLYLNGEGGNTMGETSLREYCGQIENTIEQGRFAEAVAHGKYILQQYPRYIDVYRLLGKTMLEAGQDEDAIDMFRRVLSADPEDMIAWVGLSEVHNKHDELDTATWCLERAFELAADNEAIEEELRRLYSRRDGIELQKTPLTTGALARLYLKGDLLSRAINDLRTLLAEHPERVDLRVTLAEALWRNDQRLEASGVCQQVLDELPYCLKTNLILGNIWASSGREEGQAYLRRAEALDPENKMAQQLFGDASPLPARQVRIVPLEYVPPTEKERPAWMAEVETVSAAGIPLTEKEATLLGITAALEAQIEIPSWLEEIALDEQAPVSAPPSLAEPPEARAPEEAPPAPAKEIPAWLATGIQEEPIEKQPEAIVEIASEIEEETPDWLTGLSLEPISDEEEEGEGPDWLTELGIDAAEGAPPAPGEARKDETPEWLTGISVEAGGDEATAAAPTDQTPDWLSGLREQFAKEELAPEEAIPEVEPAAAMPAPAPAEIPAWLQELAPPDAQPEAVPAVEDVALAREAIMAESIAPAEEGAPEPAWLEGDQVPSGDEALAWLERLAEGKEDELQAQIKAEAEIRMAEIMGRPAPAEPPPEEIAPKEPAAAMPIPAEVPDWLQELAPPEAAAAPATPIEAAPEEAMAPQFEEAFGWTEFGEPEAQPEIAPAVEEALPLEEIAPPPVIKKAPDVIEMEVTEPAKEAVETFAVERAYLKENPRDYDAWLALARALWQANEREESLAAYSRVIRSGKIMKDTISDLEGYLERWPDIHVQQVLGDAYMKDGQLQKALDLYRQALETL